MNTPSQNSSSKNKEGSSQLSSRNQDPDFKTSNPHIFPSLHPLSNFYRERNTNQTTALIQKRPSFAYEPVTIKKIKQNDNSENVLQNKKEINISQNTIKEEAQDIIKIENKETRDFCPISKHKDFKTPNKPSRLLKTEKKRINEEDLNVIRSFQNEVCSKKDPLVIPDNIINEIKAFQKQKINLDSKGSMGNSEIFRPRQNLQINFLGNFEREKMVYSPKNQRSIFPIPNVNPLNVQSIYNGLQMEYLSLQLKQLAPSLFEICQQNQEKLSENLKESTNRQKLGSFDIAQDLSDESCEEVDEDVQEQHIKQEIQC